MNSSKLLYIDNHGVSVTKYTLNVHQDSYPLKSIIGYRSIMITAKRFYGVSFLLLVVLVASGYINVNGFEIENLATINPVRLAILSSFAMIIVSALAFLIMRTRYALQVITTSGVQNVLTSYKKEYVDTIIQSLNIAIDRNYYGNNPAVQYVICDLLESNNMLSLN